MSQGEAVDLVVFVGCRSPDIDLKKLEKVKKVYYCYFFSGVVYLFLKSGECAASRLSLAATRTLTAAPSKWGPTSTDPARPKTLRRPALEVRMGPRGNQGIYFNTSILYCRYIIYILIHLYYIVDIL